jgi:hypothetical protein
VYEAARIALTQRNLVQVFISDFDTSALPAVFRVQALIPTADSEQILRAVSTLVSIEARKMGAAQELYALTQESVI